MSVAQRRPLSVALRELLEMTCRLGNLLRRRGVKKGDCVTIYMPPCPLAVASMLACARIGAKHNVVFAGFSAEALAERITDGEVGVVGVERVSVQGLTTTQSPPRLLVQPSPAPSSPPTRVSEGGGSSS